VVSGIRANKRRKTKGTGRKVMEIHREPTLRRAPCALSRAPLI
jgi:hypothetical protein